MNNYTTTLEEKAEVINNGPAAKAYYEKLDAMLDSGELRDPESIEDIEPWLGEIVHRVDRETMKAVCKENLEANARFSVDYYQETMQQAQEAFDALDEDEKAIYHQVLEGSMSMAINFYNENEDLFKEIIGEMLADDLRSLHKVSREIADYLQSGNIPADMKPYIDPMASMWIKIWDWTTEWTVVDA